MKNANATVLTMEGQLVGTGWYEVEKRGNEYFRWLGPDAEATTHFQIDRRIEHRLRITICSYVNEEILRSVSLHADDNTLRRIQWSLIL
jgi:hypothetical protein